MASKAYVVAMTVTELKEELKQRGLSTKGTKKELRDRLEQALYDEELDDPSSGSESGDEGTNPYSLGISFGGGGFNFEVPPESFIAEEDIIPDIEEVECEPMIVSVELSNKERLEVCPRASATTKMEVGVEGRSMGDRSLSPMVAPMILDIDVAANRQGLPPGAVDGDGSNKVSKVLFPERSIKLPVQRDVLPVSTHIQTKQPAESAFPIPPSLTLNGNKLEKETRKFNSSRSEGVFQDQMESTVVMHVTQDQLVAQTEVFVAHSTNAGEQGGCKPTGRVNENGGSKKEVEVSGGVSSRQKKRKVSSSNDIPVVTSQSEPTIAGRPKNKDTLKEDRPKQQDRPTEEDRPKQDSLNKESRLEHQDILNKEDRPKHQDSPTKEDRPKHQDSPTKDNCPKQQVTAIDPNSKLQGIKVGKESDKEKKNKDVKISEHEGDVIPDDTSNTGEENSNKKPSSVEGGTLPPPSDSPNIKDTVPSTTEDTGTPTAPSMGDTAPSNTGDTDTPATSTTGDTGTPVPSTTEDTGTPARSTTGDTGTPATPFPSSTSMECETPISPPPEPADGNSSKTMTTDKPSTAKKPTTKPATFQSPRRSPVPFISHSEEERYPPSSLSMLLQSPAPSLDDTSSLRVEPPSPRSETSTMDMPSFMDTTPMDGLGMLDADDAVGLHDNPGAVMETSVFGKGRQREVREGSSELQGANVKGSGGGGNEQGLPCTEKDNLVSMVALGSCLDVSPPTGNGDPVQTRTESLSSDQEQGVKESEEREMGIRDEVCGGDTSAVEDTPPLDTPPLQVTSHVDMPSLQDTPPMDTSNNTDDHSINSEASSPTEQKEITSPPRSLTEQVGISSPLTKPDEVTSPPTERAALSSPPTEQAVLSSPPTEQAVLSSPPTEQAVLSSPPTEQAVLSSPPTEQAVLSSPPTEQAVLSSPPTEQAFLNSPPTEQAALNSPLTEQAALNSPPTEEAALNSPPTEQAALNSPPTEQAALNSPPTEQAALNSPPTEQAALSSPPTEQAALNSPPSEQAALNSPPTEQVALSSLPSEQAALNSPPTEEAALSSPPSEQAALNSPPTEQAALNSPPTEQAALSSLPSEQAALNSPPTEETALSSPPTEQAALNSPQTVLSPTEERERQAEVTLPSIEQAEVTSPSIEPGEVTLPSIEQAEVTSPSIEPGEVTSPSIEPGEVTSPPLTKRIEVTSPSIEPGEVTSPPKDLMGTPVLDSEVDLFVHVEAEDMSVFSSEAAEADELCALSSSAHVPKRKGGGNKLSGSTSTAPLRRDTSHDSPPQPPSSSTREVKRLREDKIETPPPPSIKRRRVSGNAPSAAGGSGGVAAPGAETRKRRWGSGRQRSNSGSTSISTDVLKDIIPVELESMVPLVELGLDMVGAGSVAAGSAYGASGEEEGRRREGEGETHHQQQESCDTSETSTAASLAIEREREMKKRESERARQELETRRRIEARLRAKLEAEGKARRESIENAKCRSPSPPLHPPSKLVHVNHLTRPFTKGELLELLTGDGPILQEYFWTNRIKSHCIALYQSLEAAKATRKRLHGTKWPSTNPKLLNVDFLSCDGALKLTDGELVIGGHLLENEAGEDNEGSGTVEERKKEIEPDDVQGMQIEKEAEPIKEETDQSLTLPARSHQMSTDIPLDGRDGEEPEVTTPTEKPVVPPPKKEATKLLDELFRKTKTPPSIYWLPLTEAEVAEMEAKEKALEAEKEQRRQERLLRIQEERREKEREERSRQERLDAERERRAKARVRRRTRSRSRSRSSSRDRRKRRK